MHMERRNIGDFYPHKQMITLVDFGAVLNIYTPFILKQNSKINQNKRKAYIVRLKSVWNFVMLLTFLLRFLNRLGWKTGNEFFKYPF